MVKAPFTRLLAHHKFMSCVRLCSASLLFCFVSSALLAAQPTVTKVEPPDWWVGHSINPVRLLIRGTHLAGGILSASDGLSVSRIRINAAGTYLFADIAIPAHQKPGAYNLVLKTPEGATSIPFRLNPPLSNSDRLAGFSSNDVVYLLMPDRFADGDPSNDDPPVSRGLFDRAKPYFYHGGDFQGIIDHLPYLKELGVTAIWMTPVYDNSNRLDPPGANGQQHTDYHGYGAVDYYGVDEHFGTMALLQKLVREAHSIGIKVIQDQVENHVGPHHPWVSDPPTPTWFHGTLSHHLDENWQIWSLADPAASPGLRRIVTQGWFGGFLPDINQEDPEVRQYEIQNTLWWLGEAGFDAIRQDTWPYVSRDFWRDWMTAIKRQFPSVDVVGEVMDGDPATVSFFQGGRKHEGIDTLVDSLFDYPVYYKIREVFGQGKSLIELPSMLGHDYLYPNASLLWTVIGDHDVRRFMSEPRATVADLKLAVTCIFTIRGVPLLYYGDELGMRGGEDPDNRHDFPGGWPGDPSNAFLQSGRSPEQNSIFEYVKKLAHLRTSSAVLSRGETINLLVQDQQWVFARRLGNEVMIVAINNANSASALRVPLADLALDPKISLRGLLGVVSVARVSGAVAEMTLPPKTAEIFAMMIGPEVRITGFFRYTL